MRDFAANVHFDLILPGLKAGTREQAFRALAREAAPVCGLSEEALFEALKENAARGRSGIGDGVAIPHPRLEALTIPRIVFARLDTPVEYDALDGKPVDLICAIFAPESGGAANLQRLALITRAMRNPSIRARLHEANSEDAIRIAFFDSNNLMKAA